MKWLARNEGMESPLRRGSEEDIKAWILSQTTRKSKCKKWMHKACIVIILRFDHAPDSTVNLVDISGYICDIL